MKAWGSVALGSMMVLVLACDSGVQDDSTAGSDAAAGLPTLRIDASAGGVCVRVSCGGLNATCGPQGDGCGNVIDCGACTAADFCGGGGLSKCGAIASGTACTPKTCADLGAGCGKQGDGCGKVIDCGGCNAPAFCGGGGPSTCGAGTAQGDGGGCTPTKTSCATGDCGPIGNGCGELVPCGMCTAPELCGGGTAAQPRTPSKCGGARPDGGAMCQPTTCQAAGANCGQIGDGCGGLTPDCGQCPSGQIC